MSKNDDDFLKALEGKKIPILTLDNNWHRLFTQTEPTKEIKNLEAELNELLKKQGKLNNDTKDIRALKKRLMAEIVEQMDELKAGNNKKLEKKLEENKRLIEDCNKKLEECGDDIYDIPKKIDEVNKKLMLETMRVCYETIKENNEEIEEITKWVEAIRVELKKKVVIKQTKVKRNQNYYTYMHGIFGADVIDIFDMKYNVVPIKSESVTPSKESNVIIDEKQVRDDEKH